MVELAMRAYATDDEALCHTVVGRDDELDGLCERVAETVVRGLVATSESLSPDEMERPLTEVTRLLPPLRDIERVGDHAVNIAARSFYMITNETTLLY